MGQLRSKSTIVLLLATAVWLTGCTAASAPTPGTSASDPSTSDQSDDGVSIRGALADACTGGDFVACDVLYVAAAGNQELRDLGASCGGRDEPSGWCADTHGILIDPAALTEDCADGDMFACDALYAYSPIGSDDEGFGWTCGDRGRTSSSCITERGQVRG